jgi:predicted nucleic acid-binding protein
MPYLLDSDWVIQALANRRETVETISRVKTDGILISFIVVGEIYEGAFGAPDPQARLATFREFLEPFDPIGLDD